MSVASTDSQRQAGTGADQPEANDLGRRVRELMPQLTDDLADLVAIPSVSEVGYPEHTRPELRRAHERVLALFRDAGCTDFSSIELPDTALQPL
jgi:hypothetical protein